MKSYLSLVPISAKVHKKNSRMTKLCIVLAVFLVCAIFSMAEMELRSQRISAEKTDGSWHMSYRNITQEQAAFISARPQIKEFARYNVLNYDNTEDYLINGKRTVIAGGDSGFFTEMMPYSGITKEEFPQNETEAVATESTAKALGLSAGDTFSLITPDGAEFRYTLTGCMENTSLLTAADAYGIVLSADGLRQLAGEQAEADAWTYYALFSPHCNIRAVVQDIAAQLALTEEQQQENIKILGLMGQSSDSYMLMLYLVAAVLSVLVVVSGVLMVASSMNSNIVQRTKFFGLLRCLGAEPKQIKRFVRLEALTWCKTAIPTGVVCGVVCTWAACALLRGLVPTFFGEMPVFGISGMGITAGILVGLITVLLAAKSPARRASRVSPLTAVSGNAKNGSFTCKTYGKGKKLHGRIEIALGRYHAKGSRRNLLLIGSSFAFSIILFLGFYAGVDFMQHGITSLRPYQPDISVTSPDITNSVAKETATALSENPAVKRIYGRMAALRLAATLDGQSTTVNVISYEEHQFNWAKSELTEGNVKRAQGSEGFLMEYSGGQAGLNSTVTLTTEEGSFTVPIVGILENTPFDKNEGEETLLCSEALYEKLFGAQAGYAVLDMQLDRNASDADVAAIRRLFPEDFTFSDARQKNIEGKGILFSFAVFIYGFLLIIALIAVINIINSVGMSVSARLTQYGAMRAIGMSNRQVVTMIASETLTYVVWGVVSGCGFGLLLHYFFYTVMITSHWGVAWSLPAVPCAVIILTVLGASVLAVLRPARQIKELSIVETIAAQ